MKSVKELVECGIHTCVNTSRLVAMFTIGWSCWEEPSLPLHCQGFFALCHLYFHLVRGWGEGVMEEGDRNSGMKFTFFPLMS